MQRLCGLQPDWKDAMLQCATQHPLLQTRVSLGGIARLASRPRAITLGIGLSSPRALTRGLPFDVLGMLLPAEQLRMAAGAERVVALIADRHALANGFAPPQVERRAREVAATLRAVGQALKMPLEIVYANQLHKSLEFQRLHRRIQALAGDVHAYVTYEVADTEYLRSAYGSILKLGWAMGGPRTADALDERFFDARFRAWIDSEVGFAYSAPGRTLDAARPHAAPYLVVDPARRVLLRPDEAIDEKLAAAPGQVPVHVQRAVRRHLRRITSVYSRSVWPLSGSLVQRVRGVLDHIFGAENQRANWGVAQCS